MNPTRRTGDLRRPGPACAWPGRVGRTFTLVLLFCALALSGRVGAQTLEWAVREDNQAVPWPSTVPTPDRPGQLWERALLGHYRQAGFFAVRIDSVDGHARHVEVTPGPPARLSTLSVTWDGHEGRDPDIPPGTILSQAALDDVVEDVLYGMTREGYVLATASVVAIEPESDGYAVRLLVSSGPPVRIEGVVFPGDSRSRASYRQRVTGVRPGMRAAGLDLERIRRRVGAAPGVRRAFAPVYEQTGDSTVVLVVPVEALPPGQFDLVVGLLPATATRSATLTGGGHIQLTNAFGAGRRMDVRLDRRPGQVSSADVSVSDPMIAGSPIGAELAFHGLQQDSSFSYRTWTGGVRYRLDEQLTLGLQWNREVTRPGQAGQDIERARSGLAGVSVGYDRVDDPLVPRRGMVVRSLYERGTRTGPAGASRLERLSAQLRAFVPAGRAMVVAGGVDTRLVRGDGLDASQLVRMGGASTLRGYDEDRFLVDTAVRALLEWRYIFESSSYVFTFVDVGFLERNARNDVDGFRDVLPGAGVGMVLETAAGWLNVSWAANTEESIRNGRIHIGLAFGL